jgi:hypothetical protein
MRVWTVLLVVLAALLAQQRTSAAAKPSILPAVVLRVRAGHGDDFVSAATDAMGKLAATVADARNMPVFEFGRELDRILLASKDDAVGLVVVMGEAELMFHDYMSRLRDYYLRSFKAALDVVSRDADRVAAEREDTWQRCAKAMAAAVPTSLAESSTTWQYDGFLSELQADMDAIVEETDARASASAATAAAAASSAASAAASTAAVPPRPTTWRGRALTRAKKYGRWVAAQSLLLLFNFVQNEWVSVAHVAVCAVSPTISSPSASSPSP